MAGRHRWMTGHVKERQDWTGGSGKPANQTSYPTSLLIMTFFFLVLIMVVSPRASLSRSLSFPRLPLTPYIHTHTLSLSLMLFFNH